MNEVKEMKEIKEVNDVKESNEEQKKNIGAAYQTRFREALKKAMIEFMKERPNLITEDYYHSVKAKQILDYAQDMTLTSLVLWHRVDIIDSYLPRPFYKLFMNSLGSIILEVLERFPITRLQSYFAQEQFDLNKTNDATNSIFIRELQEKAASLESMLSGLIKRLDELVQENARLKLDNDVLRGENSNLKARLEAVLSASDSHQEEATKVRHSMALEISSLHDREKDIKQALSQSIEEKSKLFQRVHELEVENEELKTNNRRLAVINKDLLKDKHDLQSITTHQEKLSQSLKAIRSSHLSINDGDVDSSDTPGFVFFKPANVTNVANVQSGSGEAKVRGSVSLVPFVALKQG
jgi:hypothetical protein